MRLRTARKEAKETMHWLELLDEVFPLDREEINGLKHEAEELKNILSAIITKSERHV